MSKHRSTQFNCFSSPVMIATTIIETALIIYTLWRYKLDELTKLVIICLLALAVFQICEYNVCTSSSLRASDWARLGFVAISMLPPLGLHILHVLAGKPKRRLVAAAYTSMAVVMTYFFAYKMAFTGYQCTGNYVIFQIGTQASIAYGVYYYGWLLIAMYLGARWASGLMQTGKPAAHRLRAVRAIIVGYLVFLVPTALVYSVIPTSRQAIPSIMCGFAILFALILTLYILPLAERKRKHKIL